MKLFKFSITLLFAACLLLLAGCMHEKDLSASGSIPAEQTEYEAKEISITTLEQAKEFVYEHCIDGIDFTEQQDDEEDEDLTPDM